MPSDRSYINVDVETLGDMIAGYYSRHPVRQECLSQMDHPIPQTSLTKHLQEERMIDSAA